MAKEILDRPDIGAVFQNMRRKRVSQHMRRDAFIDPSGERGATDGVLKGALENVMTAPHAGLRVDASFALWKQPLPRPAHACVRVFTRQTFGQPNSGQARLSIFGPEFA